MSKLDGKVAVITGAAGGIGQAAARLFASEGAKVMLVDVNEEPLIQLANSIGIENTSYAVADVSKASEVERYLKKTLDEFGKVDVTLLNAGIEGRIADLVDQTEKLPRRIKKINCCEFISGTIDQYFNTSGRFGNG